MSDSELRAVTQEVNYLQDNPDRLFRMFDLFLSKIPDENNSIELIGTTLTNVKYGTVEFNELSDYLGNPFGTNLENAKYYNKIVSRAEIEKFFALYDRDTTTNGYGLKINGDSDPNYCPKGSDILIAKTSVDLDYFYITLGYSGNGNYAPNSQFNGHTNLGYELTVTVETISETGKLSTAVSPVITGTAAGTNTVAINGNVLFDSKSVIVDKSTQYKGTKVINVIFSFKLGYKGILRASGAISCGDVSYSFNQLNPIYAVDTGSFSVQFGPYGADILKPIDGTIGDKDYKIVNYDYDSKSLNIEMSDFMVWAE